MRKNSVKFKFLKPLKKIKNFHLIKLNKFYKYNLIIIFLKIFSTNPSIGFISHAFYIEKAINIIIAKGINKVKYFFISILRY